MQLLIGSSVPASGVAIAFAAAAGVIGALVALLKLKPEANQSAVLQAQGAMETMVQLQDELERALDRANDRATRADARADLLREQLAECRERLDHIVDNWGPFPA